MKVYISGQITGLDLRMAEYLFKQAEQELFEMECEYVNPMEILPYDPKHSWKDYMLEDINVLFDCDAIYMLKNWTNSKGARIERAIAHEMGLPIMYQQ